ncbi:hypothetical protein WJX74_005903 [Apatococcus lobatus]|uniref:Exonuclease domain-containing protein n=1 Tax=Apatococcus lobatus TaxID=904363 RepID=A0AAW1R375_9CHLO
MAQECGHRCKDKANCKHVCCKHHLHGTAQAGTSSFNGTQALPSQRRSVSNNLSSQRQSYVDRQQATGPVAQASQGTAAEECKHPCKSKATCGHACCKRHLPEAARVAWAAGRADAAIKQSVSAQEMPQECRHSCRSKATCGHDCCKRHLPAELQAAHYSRKADTEPTIHQPLEHHLAKPARATPAALSLPSSAASSSQDAFSPQDFAHGTAIASTSSHPPAASSAKQERLDAAQDSSAQPLADNTWDLVSVASAAATGEAPGGKPAPHVSSASKLPLQSSLVEPQYEFFAFDLESTGLSPQNDRIMEIAVKHMPDTPVGEQVLSPTFATLVSSGQTPNMGAYKVHKISRREADEHGNPFRQAWAEVQDYVNAHCPAGATPVLVAHNGSRFDNKMLEAECVRISQPIPGEWMWLDTLPLARQRIPELASHSQAALQRAFDIPEGRLQHRASEDVKMLEQVLWKLAGHQSLAALMQAGSTCCGIFDANIEQAKFK